MEHEETLCSLEPSGIHEKRMYMKWSLKKHYAVWSHLEEDRN
jgi:hypothetical protein